jgi:hypothetical protein
LKRKRRKNKIMLEVLNVEMLWQRAIRWKGMYVKKKKKKKKNRKEKIDKQESEKYVCQKG